MYLAFLMLSALDLLRALETSTTPAERAGYAVWIYACQSPAGGFRMAPPWRSSGAADGRAADPDTYDPPTVPATYFALCALLVLGDDLSGVYRAPTLRWLRSVQRADGSVGEASVAGRVEGGRDPRFAYCAAGVRWMLRGGGGGGGVDVADVPDLDVDALVRCIGGAQVGAPPPPP